MVAGATASALIGLMDPLLGKLSTLLGSEYGKLKGVRREIAFLRDELRTMNTALEVASQLEEPGAQVKEWMRQVRELSYDVEDCIDVFMHHLSENDACDGIMRKTSRRLKTLRVRHRIAGQISELKERAMGVNNLRNRYEIGTVTSSSTSLAIDPRLPALFEEASRLVGIQGPRDELIKWLAEGIDWVQQRRVVAIVGFGGLGKTTLANQVYQSVRCHFDCTAFVSVSRTPNINKILTDILQQVLDTSKPRPDDQKQHIKRIIEDLEHKTLEEYQLINIIKEYLQNNRYFIIIDDIWSKQAWKIIQCAFPQNNNASRIMTTTRIQDVAKSCCFSHQDYVYPMKPLNTDDSKSLLLKRTFVQEDDCPTELKEVVHEILKKCGGLPLAIINIASLLASKPVTKQEWEKVHNSIGSALEQDEDLEVVKRILFLSYYDLPHQLKICLLYLSVFPEDFEINRERLIWRWIAEGFIKKQRGQSLEEVGERYFNELINRNMIQPMDFDYSGRPKACRVHDIMLDLIISISTEENFLSLLADENFSTPTNTIRRLSLQGKYKDDIIWPRASTFSHVRSLSVFGVFSQIPPLLDLQVLRVLDLQDWQDMEDAHIHIEDIGNLHQLRYLRLGKTNINKIPRQIGKLKHLQTLDLRTCMKLKELPATIIELSQLVRLFVWNGVKFPKGISNMKSLEELSKFDGSSNTADIVLELGDLTRLKMLRVGWHPNGSITDEESYKESLASALRKLGERDLQSLRVDYYQNVFYSVDFLVDSWQPVPRRLQSFEMFGPVYFTRVPAWMSSLSELTCLSINVGQVGAQDVHVLKNLRALLFCFLYTKQPPQETLTISCGGFQCLKEFLFFPYDKDGRSIKFEAGAMLKLQAFSFGFVARDDLCAGNGSFDFGIQHLTCLKQVDIIIYCNGARAWEVEAAEVAIRSAVGVLPNHPTLKMRRYFQDKMLKDEGTKN